MVPEPREEGSSRWRALSRSPRLETATVTIASRLQRSGERYMLASFGFSPFLASAFSLVFARTRRKGRRARRKLFGRSAIALTLVAATIFVPAMGQKGVLDLLGPRAAHAQSVSSSMITYTYDANGNMLTRSDATLSDTYTYDAENRLVTADVQIGPSPVP